MELDYFISKSSNPLSTRDKWLSSGSYSPLVSTQLTGITGGDTFSAFFTLDRKSSGIGTILSNYTNTGGFTVGLNSNNEIFAFSSDPDIDSIYFPEIRLGKKNCLSITKHNQRLTVLRYDPISQSIHQSISKSFKPETNLQGAEFKVGRNSVFGSNLGINGISGVFEQVVFFKQSMDLEDAEIIFSGFLPIKKTQNTTFSKTYSSSSIELNSDSIYNITGIYKFLPFLDSVSSGFIPVKTGNFTALFSGTGIYIPSGIKWTGMLNSGDDSFCYPTGNTTFSGGQTGYAPFFNGNLIFTDTAYASMNNLSERVVSHLVSFYPVSDPTQTDFFSYNILEKYTSKTTTTFTNPTGSYISGFTMEGVVLENKFCNLYKYYNTDYEDIEFKLPFDLSKGRFAITDEFIDGYNVYWKYGQVTDYTISGKYIDSVSIEEDNSYDMFFDKVNYGRILMYSGFSFATGFFPVGASQVYGSVTSGVNYDRISSADFLETSSFHIIHGKEDKITFDTLSGIYLNDGANWTASMYNDL